MFFNIQSDFSDIDETADIVLQFFVTVDFNYDNDMIIQNLSFIIIFTAILEFFKLAFNKFQNVFMH